MPQPWTPLLALALAPAFGGCCPDSCGDECPEPTVVEAPKPVGGGIASLNGFVENKGQWPKEVLFFARRGGVETTVLRDALAFRPTARSEDEPAPAALILHLPGDAAGRVVEGLGRLATKHHFLLGHQQASDAAGFECVALRRVLPGVDLVLRADGGAFEYDLFLDPGAPLDELVIEVEGARALEVPQPDVLVLHTEAGEVEQRIHASWQGRESEPVACRFRALEPSNGRQRFAFEAPEWDRELALVLDPSLVYLTYVGGSGQELLVEAEVDATGAMYLLARTSTGTPVTSGAFIGTPQGSVDTWIGKLSPDGSTLEWATFLGSAQSDDPKDLALADNGSVVVVGSTWSPGFPATPGAFQEQIGGGGTTKSDVYVARLSPTGTSLEWATFYGATDHDAAWACALYPNGDVLVAFEPFSSGLPSTPGAIDEIFHPGDLALFRLSADGTQRLWQTYFRASTVDDLMIDDESNAYLGGAVLNTDAPLMTTTGVLKETMAPGDSDGFVTKMHPDGTQLLWSTYLGGDPNDGSGLDRVYAIDIDAAHAVYVAGYTHSDIFPVTPGAFQSDVPGSIDGFAAKLLPNGSGLAWATYVGASGFAGSTLLRDIVVDQAGSITVFGDANEPDFPVTPDAFQPVFIGPLPSSADTLLCKLDVVGESLLYGTWLGGTGTDTAVAVALDVEAIVYVGFRGGPSLPTTTGAFQPIYAGSVDVTVAKFDLDVLPWSVLSGGLAGKDVPTLVGLGPLTPGSATRLALRGAPSGGPAWIVAGAFQIDVPFLGGTLVPFPTVVLPASTGVLGELDFAFAWPAAPPGTPVFFQVWTPDPFAIQGWSASHGLKALSQ